MRIRKETGQRLLVLASATTLCTLAYQAPAASPPGQHNGWEVITNAPSRAGRSSDGGIAGVSSCGATIDDGSGENSLGNGVGKSVWGNQFDGGGFCNIAQVQVAFGPIPAATPVKIFLLSDPNQDGDPVDSQVLAVVSGVSANEDTNTFNTYNIGPVAVGHKYFAAVLVENMPLTGNSRFPARFDTAAPIAVKSWIASTFANNANPFNGSNRGEISSLGFPGDFMIRTVGTGNPCSTALKACHADVAPLPSGNGIVNVDDLLAVINTWGTTGNPNPRPQGDNAPQPNGNCQVNVDDLLGVINQWGPCTPPPNNACASAITVTNGTTSWNNDYATTDGPSGGSCETNMSRDIWFNYVATCTGAVTVDTVGGTGNYDTIMAVYQGNTCTGTLLGCNDDIDFAGGNAYSRVIFGATAGQTYKIRVGSFGTTGPTGDGKLNISCASNDTCAGAAPMAIGASVSGTLVGAVQAVAPACNSVALGKGRWHTVVGDGNTLTASLCNSPSNNNDLWSARLSVYCGDSCNDLFCVTAAEANATCSNPNLFFSAQVSFCTFLGRTYYILVHSDAPPTSVGYVLNVTTDGIVCSNPALCSAIPPPANDECTGAITIPDGPAPINTNYDSTTATSSPAPPPGGVDCSGTAYNQFTKDQWFKYTPAQTATYDIGMCGGSPVFDTMLAIYTGACGSLVEIGCNDDGCAAGGFSHITTTLTANVQYTIRVGLWNNTAGGPTTLVITKPVCGNGIPEAGEQCDDGNGTAGDGCTNCTLDTCIFPCVGTPECEPCLADGSSDTCNGGCLNGLTTPPGPYFSQTIVAGQRVCGTCSTYTPAPPATQTVDGDHWLFIPPSSGTYHLESCAEFNGAVNFFINPVGDVTNCGSASAFVNTVGTGNQVLALGAPSIQDRPLVGGQKYAVRIRPAGTPLLPCNPGSVGNRYSFVITGPIP